MRIRQIALVAWELDATVARLCDGLGLEVCHRDPGVEAFGLVNALMAVGDTFLEVVSPAREGTTAGRLLERRGGDGGYMCILQTDDLARDRERIEGLGVRVVWDIALDDMTSFHMHPRDVGGAIVSLDQPRPAESWRWAGPDWRDRQGRRELESIVGAELQAGDPAAMAARWGQVLDLPVQDAGEGRRRIELDGGALRFVPVTDGRGEGLGGFDVRAKPGLPGRELALCGTRIRVLPGA